MTRDSSALAIRTPQTTSAHSRYGSQAGPFRSPNNRTATVSGPKGEVPVDSASPSSQPAGLGSEVAGRGESRGDLSLTAMLIRGNRAGSNQRILQIHRQHCSRNCCRALVFASLFAACSTNPPAGCLMLIEKERDRHSENMHPHIFFSWQSPAK